MNSGSQRNLISHSCNLTAEQKDLLIESVKNRPVIWDCSLEAHQDVQNRRDAFAEIAAILSDEKTTYTGQEMQTEWKKLRDIFNRTLKKVVSSGNEGEITWRFWNKLQFIAENEKSQIYKCVQKWSRRYQNKRKFGSSTNHSTQLQQNEIDDGSINGTLEGDDEARAELFKVDDDDADEANSDPDLSWLGSHLLGASGNDKIITSEEHDQIEEEPNGTDLGSLFESSPLPKIINDINRVLKGVVTSNSASGTSTPTFAGNSNFTKGGNKRKSPPMKRPRFSSSHHLVTTPKAHSRLSTATHRLPATMVTAPSLLSQQQQRQRHQQVYNSNLNGPSASTTTTSTAATTTNGCTTFSMINGIDAKSDAIKSDVSSVSSQQQVAATATSMAQQLAAILNGANGNEQQQHLTHNFTNGSAGFSGNDHFDIFGMFVASQVRTVSSRNPPAGLKLKRALINLCFQYESESQDK